MLSLREFLDHLAWYWIIARYSQAREFQKARDEVALRPITVTQTEELLRRLYELQEQITGGKTAAVQYFPELRALQITRAGFHLALGPKFADDDATQLFSGAGRPFFDRVREFVHEPTYDQWRNQGLGEIDEIGDLRSFLAPWLPGGPPRFFQTLLQWSEKRGVPWIVFRDLSMEDARQFQHWSGARLNALIAGHDQHRHIRGEQRPWLQHTAADIADLDISRYTAMVRHLIGVATGAELLEEGVFGLAAPTRLLMLPTTSLGGLMPPAPRAARGTLVITNGKYDQVAHELPAPSRDHEYAIFDVQSTREFLGEKPWLWSKYLGPQDVLVLEPGDWDGLLRALAPAPFPDYPLVESFPARRITAVGTGSTAVLHGRIGMGKTIALYQLARKFRPHDLLIVIRPNATPEHQIWLSDLFATTKRTVTCLLDGLHEDDIDWLRFLVRERSRHLRKGKPFISLLAAYSREETSHVRAKYWRELQDFDAFDIHAPDVVRAAAISAASFKKIARDRLYATFGVRGWLPSIRRLLHAIPELNKRGFTWPGKHGWLPPLPEEQQFWTAKFRRMASDPQARDLFTLLVILRVFYWADGFFVADARIGREIMETTFSSLVTNDSARFHAAWATLQDDWLVPNEAAGISYVDLRDAQVIDAHLRPTPIVREFLNWMINGGGHWEWREIVLDRLSQRVYDKALAQRMMAAYLAQLRHRRDTEPDTWNKLLDEASLQLAEKQSRQDS